MAQKVCITQVLQISERVLISSLLGMIRSALVTLCFTDQKIIRVCIEKHYKYTLDTTFYIICVSFNYIWS